MTSEHPAQLDITDVLIGLGLFAFLFVHGLLHLNLLHTLGIPAWSAAHCMALALLVVVQFLPLLGTLGVLTVARADAREELHTSALIAIVAASTFVIGALLTGLMTLGLQPTSHFAPTITTSVLTGCATIVFNFAFIMCTPLRRINS